mgnify:CR=1 FL=1
MAQCLDQCGNELTAERELGGICDSCLSGDDLFIWPDGVVASREEIDAGEFSYKSDDYRPMTEAEADHYFLTGEIPE